MVKKNMKPNGKHLKEEDRAFIAECLQAEITFKEIGKLLVKDPSTIAKEVKANRVFQSAPSYNNGIVNLCVHRKGCQEALSVLLKIWGRIAVTAVCYVDIATIYAENLKRKSVRHSANLHMSAMDAQGNEYAVSKNITTKP